MNRPSLNMPSRNCAQPAGILGMFDKILTRVHGASPLRYLSPDKENKLVIIDANSFLPFPSIRLVSLYILPERHRLSCRSKG